MVCLGFHSISEFFVFLSSLLVGITMVMGPNAVNSAPKFMYDYYMYIGDSKSTAKVPKFWNGILTYYTIVTMVAQSIHEPTNVTPFLCRFSLLFRLEISCLIMMVEILVILLMPFCGTSEYGAIAGLMIAAYLGGMARAYFENTGYALFCPFSSKMMSAMLIGSAVSGSIVSMMQIVLKKTLPDTHDSILFQSILYFSISLCFFFISGALLFLLMINSYAKQYVAELRSRRGFWRDIYRPLHQSDISNENHGEKTFDKWASDDFVVTPDSHGRKHDASPREGVKKNTITFSKGTDISTAELLKSVKVWSVIKKTSPMILASFLTFCVTYFIYPGVLVAVDSKDSWYPTLIMACYNFSDLVGRLLSMCGRLWPSRRFIVIATIARIAFIPLMVLCALHIISGQTTSYVFTTLLGLTNGFFGTLAMVYAPLSPGLESDAKQMIAGQVAGACLLFGCVTGSLLQLTEVIPSS